MEDLLKSFFSGLTNAIAEGIKQGSYASAPTSAISNEAIRAAEIGPQDDPKSQKDKKTRKRRTKAEIEADNAKEAKDDKDAKGTDAPVEDDDDQLEDVGDDMDYEGFMEHIRNVLRAAAQKGEGKGAEAKKKAIAWLKENKGVDQFMDLDTSDYVEVLGGITNAVA
jgi:hypothetical protein